MRERPRSIGTGEKNCQTRDVDTAKNAKLPKKLSLSD
jgi:hypothetical protein